MPKISYSLAIAFAIHILILVLSTFLIDQRPAPFLFGTQNTISMNFGLSSDEAGGTPKKAATSRTETNISPKAGTHVSSNSQNNSAAKIEAASEAGTGSSVGPGSGPYDFASSAVSYQEPIYPRLAIKRELQGSVTVRVRVTPEGKPSNTEILKSSGYELLDRAALDAISKWKFHPRPAAYFVEKDIVFQLKN